MKPSLRTAGVVALGLVLSACQAVNYGPPPLRQQQPVQRDALQGQWVDPNGIVSIFSNGNFETRTTDTNSLLASGTYTYVSDRLVQIDLTSRIRGTQSSVNCAIIGPNQLNCTADSGSQFSLARRSTA